VKPLPELVAAEPAAPAPPVGSVAERFAAFMRPGALALAALPPLGLGAGVLLAVAATWELTSWKWRAVRRCHLIQPMPPRGAAADAACAREGLRYGARCVGACWAPMLAMVAAGHLAVGLMALLTLVLSAEKIVVRSARLRGPAAAALAGAAVLALL
jgi:predicted metal-binding membrane protein